jgi:hypothetical protein
MIELLIFLLVTGAVVAWWQLMQGRQKARKVADPGPYILVNYGFEFATNGAIRRHGEATIGFPASLIVTLDMVDGRLIEKFRGH